MLDDTTLITIDTRRPLDITRTEFRRCIHAGVMEARAAGMSAGDARRLYVVGRTAVFVGLNFEGCPLTLAGLYDDGVSGYTYTCGAFVGDYDSAVADLGAFKRTNDLYPTCLRVGDGS